jgi:chromosome segregation protein
MQLKSLEISGFKSFGKKSTLFFDAPITAIVGPNGSGKSNVAEAFRWVLGEQSLKSLRGKRGEDLIFSGPVATTKLSRASVSVVFDNSDRHFDLDFDEVKITREVFRDGVNEYSINGTVVRLKDILELLAKISLGASGHHIISQGEADRVLTAGAVERRTMIEEALGLKLYQWKLDESEKKLAKTEENKKQVESLRREIAPHLKFLKKQVEKIERADELRRELKSLYREYLKREKAYIDFWQKKVTEEKTTLAENIRSLDDRINILSGKLHADSSVSQEQKKIAELEQSLRILRNERDEASRALGRLEGVIEVKNARLQAPEEEEIDRPVSLTAVRKMADEITMEMEKAEATNDFFLVRQIFTQIRQRFENFFSSYTRPEKNNDNLAVEIETLRADQDRLEQLISDSNNREQNILSEIVQLKQDIKSEEDTTRGAERELYELKTKRGELFSKRNELISREENTKREDEGFQREIQEGLVLVDREILMFENEVISIDEVLGEDRKIQEERRRQIEKVKIRLEDMGADRGDVLEEYKEVTERDTHLEHELADLTYSEAALKQVMLELRTKIDVEFKEGINKINSAFQQFFAEMFGGGTAKLEIVLPVNRKNREAKILSDDEMMTEMDDNISNGESLVGKEGIEINVTLPKKRIKGLAMLSGGERALTSIALLFAMSQVNPPPFLILDETDAALDEANSRKYGQMISNLSKSSQLIVITHNRETMARASVLYGVTMGGDGVSRLLSIKFDEATVYAK